MNSEKPIEPTESMKKAEEAAAGFQFPLWGKIALLIAAVSLAVIGYIKSEVCRTLINLILNKRALAPLKAVRRFS